ncbi:hypothetical protein Naga_100457g3, partial [Nannochloropsis gaditana]
MDSSLLGPSARLKTFLPLSPPSPPSPPPFPFFLLIPCIFHLSPLPLPLHGLLPPLPPSLPPSVPPVHPLRRRLPHPLLPFLLHHLRHFLLLLLLPLHPPSACRQQGRSVYSGSPESLANAGVHLEGCSL